jgi:hypothetical protein
VVPPVPSSARTLRKDDRVHQREHHQTDTDADQNRDPMS